MIKKNELLKLELKTLNEENKKLVQSNKRYEFIQSLSQEAIAVFDKDHRCIEANNKLLEMFGYSRDDLIGFPGFGFMAEESKELVKAKVAEGNARPYEAVMMRKDGTTFWGLVQGTGIEYDGIKLRITTCIDISEHKKLQAKTALLNAEYETIFNNSQVGMIFLSVDRKIQRVNQKFAEIFGYESAEVFEGKCIDMIHLSKENYERFGTYYSTVLAEGKPVKIDYQFKNANGKAIWVNVSGSVVDKAYPPDLNKGIVWVFEDIEDRKRAEVDLQKAYEKLEIIFNNTVMGILVLDNNSNIIRVNRVLANMFGYGSPEELEGKSSKILQNSDESFLDFSEKLRHSSAVNSVYTGDYNVKRIDGSMFWVAASGRVVDGNNPCGPDMGVIWSVMDITKRKTAETKLIELSRMDSLTNIYNRRYFYELAEIELGVHKRYKRPFAFVSIDIDLFKSINDTYGHAVGDKALVFFAALVKRLIRETDIFGRIGGEEFGLCLLDVDLGKAVSIIEKIRNKLSMALPNLNEGIPEMTVSAGVVVVCEDENIEIAARRADKLLYEAKNSGRNKVLY